MCAELCICLCIQVPYVCTAMFTGSVHATATHMHGVFTYAQVLNSCCLLLYVERLFVCKLTSATYVLSAVSHLYVGATYVHCSVVCSVHTVV